ncbi:LysM peptidoglycan-binding domain-containing protein [Streptomyces sp. NPDC059101]|uniref:LysM peptidoglycan-binding domain-containing protein n=1 Tax=Streptomyces sp. NPDC059101 TaxID=3346728 RepID=UPI0036BC5DF3
MAPTTGPLRTAGTLLRALVATVVLLALVAGAPYLLLALGHPPTELSAGLKLLTEQDDGTLLLVVLTLVGWIAWAAFALSVIVEVVALARRRSAPRIKGLGGLQSLAGALIGGIVLLAPTAASAASPATAAAVATHHTTRDTAKNTAAATAEAQKQAGPRHTVASSRETLWDLAQQYLGSGTRWRDIAALNATTYPALASGDAPLQQGWVLALPPDATVHTELASAPAADHHGDAQHTPATYTVRTGDSLFNIADEELGDANRWTDLYKANKDQVHDPDLIYPGQRLDLPQQQATPTPPAPPRPHTPSPEKMPAPAPDRAAGGQHDASPAPDEAPPAPSPSTEHTTTPAPASPRPAPTQAPATPAAQAADDTVMPATMWAGAGILAAALIGTLATRRILQQRRRAFGRRIPMPTGRAADTERKLRSVQHLAGFDLLNTALRTLAAHLADADRPLPDLDAVVLHEARLDLWLADEQEPLPPFTAVPDQPRLWTTTAAHPALADDHSDMDAPYPALVSLGWDAQQRLVLVDLERIGVLSLTGESKAAQSVLHGIAVELATASVHGPLEVTVTGNTAPGLDAVAPERVAREALEAVTTRLSAHAADQRRALADLQAQGLGEARVQDDTGGAWTPHVVLADNPDDATALIEVLADEPRTASAVIVTAPTTSPLPEGAWALACTGPDQSVTLPGSGLTVHLQGLPSEVYEDAVELLRVASSTATLPAEPESVPAPQAPLDDEHAAAAAGSDGAGLPAEYADDEAEEEADAEEGTTNSGAAPAPESAAPNPVPAAADAVNAEPETAEGPTLLLLGPVSLDGALGRVDSNRVAPSTELAAYLYLNPDVDHHAIDNALWPASRVNKGMRTAVVSRLRVWLGQDADGRHYFPRLQDTNGHRYRLNGVACDWTRFQHHARTGLNDTTEDGTLALRRALALVRGRPLSAVDPQRYGWAEPVLQEMCEAIVDTAVELSGRLREAGDHTGALWAAGRGLLACEESEALHRAAFRAHHAAGDIEALREAAARLTRINDRLGSEGVDMDAETAQLLADLLPRTRQTA